MATVPARYHNSIQCSVREILMQAGLSVFSKRIAVTVRKLSDGCRNAMDLTYLYYEILVVLVTCGTWNHPFFRHRARVYTKHHDINGF